MIVIFMDSILREIYNKYQLMSINFENFQISPRPYLFFMYFYSLSDEIFDKIIFEKEM